MCELPARSMPGSEMLFVEKTRIRGTKAGASTWASPATDAVMGRRLLATHEDALVAVGDEHAEERMADLCGPRPDVALGDGVARPDLDDGSDRHRAHALLRLEEGARTGGAAGVDDLVGSDGFELGLGDGGRHGSVLPSRRGCWSRR